MFRKLFYKFSYGLPRCSVHLLRKCRSLFGHPDILPAFYIFIMALIMVFMYSPQNVYAVDDMWTVANKIIVDIYNKIAGISTVLAGLMSAVAVLGAKLSNNQHKIDQAWDWLKRIWVAWAVINGIGAFIAFIKPLFDGLNTIT